MFLRDGRIPVRMVQVFVERPSGMQKKHSRRSLAHFSVQIVLWVQSGTLFGFSKFLVPPATKKKMRKTIEKA